MLDSGDVDTTRINSRWWSGGRPAPSSSELRAERDARLALLDRAERLGRVPNVESATYPRRMPGSYPPATAVERGIAGRAVVRAPRGWRRHPAPRLTPAMGRGRRTVGEAAIASLSSIANWLATCGPTDAHRATPLVGER
jgi:hypothetical protein